jgi:hypothetical protein
MKLGYSLFKTLLPDMHSGNKLISILILILQTAAASFSCSSTAAGSDAAQADELLSFAVTQRGDRIMDYSHAGYEGGGVALPKVPVVETVSPQKGVTDYTDIIQAAIDRAGVLPFKDGFRGAVLLAAGDYPCSRELRLDRDGVVLRGSASAGKQRSRILMSGGKHTAVVARKKDAKSLNMTRFNEPATRVTDSYVPFGSSGLTLESAAGFRKGDIVWIQKKVTQKWIEYMHMDDLWRDGKHEVWLPEGSWITVERQVESVSGHTLRFTVPLADSFDAQYTGDSTFVSPAPSGGDLVHHCGVESLCIESPAQAESHTTAKYYALSINGEDCWAQDIRALETMESIRATGKRITLRKISVIREADHVGSSKPAEFAPNAAQILMDSCYVKGNNIWYIGIGSRIFGPLVVLNSSFEGNGRIQGHMRWSTAFLMDNCKVPGGGIDFINRGEMGSGHGWGTAWSVAWNCEAEDYINQLPPGTFNWMLGCIGERKLSRRPFDKEGPMLEEGYFRDHGAHVLPHSLYLYQLERRCGKQALRAIGY